MSKPHIELLIENESGQDVVAYPFIEADHVTLSNGMGINEMLDQDVSMPTVTHDTTAIKVGVGDSDVSSSVVDSAVNMTIKGETYQNILPDPTLRNEMQGKSMQRLNEGYDNIEVVDGISKSAILSGQTLVNLLERFHHGCSYDSETGIYTSTQNEWVEPVRTAQNVKVNVPYTLFAKVNTTSDYIYIRLDYHDGTVAKDSIINGHVTPNSDIFIKTTVVFSKENRIRFVLRNAHDGVVKMSNIMLIEGDHTNQDIPYFEGMASCKMPVLMTTGKNLFNNEFTTISNYDNQTYSRVNVNKIIGKNGNFTISVLEELNSKGKIWFNLYINGTEKFNLIVNGATVNKKYTFLLNEQNQVEFGVYSEGISKQQALENIKNNFKIQLEEGSTATPYEPHKSNILQTPEEVVLKGVGDLKDTLNCNTGEYVERIGEYIITGNENWSTNLQDNCQRFSFYHTNIPIIRNNGYSDSKIYVNCDKLAGVIWNNSWNTLNTITTNNGSIYFHLPLETTMEQAKAMMIGTKIQYVLETPTVKTVDLSSSGNWEKIVLDGSENWTYESPYLRFYTPVPNMVKTNNYLGKLFCDNPNFILTTNYSGMKDLGEMVLTGYNDANNSYPNENWIYITVKSATDVGKLKQYLQQNPITLWYQTATTLDSTQVKQPIFFKDGHIQLSSGVDNSLIPTLDYQAKTSNSYVMDLMKPNTKYTMKAKSANGTFTIDGTSYNVGTNTTFTSPSSMTNKFLVMSNKTNEEVMILEGDVVSKAIPYFKGIKSAFEDESKIEVLSTDSNLLINNQRLQEEGISYRTKGWDAIRLTTKAKKVKIVVKNKTGITGTKLNVKDDIESESNFLQLFAVNEAFTKIEREYSLKNSDVISFCSFGTSVFNDGTFFDNYDIEVYTLDNVDETLVVEKSNNTKIPLLSPLKSLPNGVCDEIILDRENNKAQIIQRIDCVVLNGDEEWNAYPTMEQERTLLFQTMNTIVDGKNAYCMCDSYPYNNSLWSGYYEEGIQLGGSKEELYKHIDVRLSKLKVSSNDKVKVRDYFRENPTTVLYELQTPIITEVDLEGFPYIYKDGHIFLNSEIAPTTEITYSINQAQQIESANENLQRHEKEISHLQKLIAQYIQVEYESTLLSLKI